MPAEIIGIIGGSGLGDTLAEKLTDFKSREIETPFGKPSGPVMFGKFADKDIAFINRHGPGHKLSPSDVPSAANIFALKKFGVRSVIATCAVGSLSQKIAPKDLVIPDQIIDKTVKRQNSFFTGIAAVHCEMAQPFCNRLRKMLLNLAVGVDAKTHEKATYVCMEGPQFSTRAESLMHIKWGGDLIGMTAMPEAKLAREAQICYALVALVSDYDCWKPHEAEKDKQTLLAEIIGNLNRATENAIKLIESFLQKTGQISDEDCSCRKSLELAMWTAQDRICPEEKGKLNVLFE